MQLPKTQLEHPKWFRSVWFFHVPEVLHFTNSGTLYIIPALQKNEQVKCGCNYSLWVKQEVMKFSGQKYCAYLVLPHPNRYLLALNPRSAVQIDDALLWRSWKCNRQCKTILLFSILLFLMPKTSTFRKTIWIGWGAVSTTREFQLCSMWKAPTKMLTCGGSGRGNDQR